MPETEWHKWASAPMQGAFTAIVLVPALRNVRQAHMPVDSRRATAISGSFLQRRDNMYAQPRKLVLERDLAVELAQNVRGVKSVDAKGLTF